MRFAIAIIVASIIIAGIFGFARIVTMQEEIWREQNVAVSPIAIMAMQAARWWNRYWYIGSGLILIGCLGATAAFSRPGREK